MAHGFRFVVVDPRTRIDGKVPTVAAANASGADQATQHLLDLGHRRIAAITGPSDLMASKERLRGYNAALAAAGVTPAPELVIESNFGVRKAAGSASSLLDLPNHRPRSSPSTTSWRSARCRPPRAQSARPRGALDHRLRRHRRGGAVQARADHGAPTARRDGPHGGESADPTAREPSARGLHVELATRLIVGGSTGSPDCAERGDDRRRGPRWRHQRAANALRGTRADGREWSASGTRWPPSGPASAMMVDDRAARSPRRAPTTAIGGPSTSSSVRSCRRSSSRPGRPATR